MKPTPEQLNALHLYAERHGRNWKSNLMNAWLIGNDVFGVDGHLLRQIRNSLGPVWLRGFKL